MKKKTKKNLSCALLVGMSLLLTGCTDSQNAAMSYRIDAPAGKLETAAGESYAENYLSDSLCVIPKNGQTKKRDEIMTSRASLVINDSDQKMLYAKNIYQKIYPASITKIVTALVTLKYGNLYDTVTISYNASHITEPGAKLCGFEQGDKIVLKDLLYSFLICSGNDAGVAIAEHIAGNVADFAKMMNAEMQNIGAVHSHFVNPHGLHNDKHYTTAYDLYLVFHHLIQNDTFRDIVNQPSFVAKFKSKKNKTKKLYFTSTDRYLVGRATPPAGMTVIGGKTGTTAAAGSCLILYSKNKKGKGYISVVLKAQGGYDLYTQMNHLLAYAANDK